MAEVLSQSQIDALLNAARSGDMDLNVLRKDEPEKKYRKYDFYSPQEVYPATGSRCSTAFLTAIPA